MKKAHIIYIIFFVNLVIHLILHYLREGSTSEYYYSLTIGIGITKLLVVLLALAILVTSANNAKQFLWIYWGLILGWFGDIFLFFSDNFLLFTQGSELYAFFVEVFFMLGLASFLAGHILYIVGFMKDRKLVEPTENQFVSKSSVMAWTGVIGVYAICIFSYLLPFLGEMALPVLLYVSAISVMLWAAIRRPNHLLNYKVIIIGALFFIVSDTILAISIFKGYFPYASIFVMTTYGLAQLFIASGYAAGDKRIQ